jgi:hypothetical protein
MEASLGKRWGAEQRLEFIEFFAFWEGAINRSHVMDKFGVSAPQASNDLAAYQQLAPNNLQYDLSSKRYVRSSEFVCRLIHPDADRYLKQLTMITTHATTPADTWLGAVPSADVIPIPARRVDPKLLQDVLSAIRERQSIEIQYHTMTKHDDGTSLWRRITPHSLGSDGFRWHIRAFCHRSNRFKDFLLSRCWDARAPGEPQAGLELDEQWNTFFEIKLIANPALTESQRYAVEVDYGMKNGQCVLTVRRALLYYFNKRFSTDIAEKQAYGSLGDPREVPIVISNKEEYISALDSLKIRSEMQSPLPGSA